MWPAGRIALRSFSERPITFAFDPVAIFSSSPTVLTSMRRGEAPSPAPPTIFSAGSDTLVTARQVGAVADRGHGGEVLVAGPGEDGAAVQQAAQAAGVLGAEACQVVVAEL